MVILYNICLFSLPVAQQGSHRQYNNIAQIDLVSDCQSVNMNEASMLCRELGGGLGSGYKAVW